jgi:hypothetical protein
MHTLRFLAISFGVLAASTFGATQTLAHGQSVTADPTSGGPGVTVSVKGEQLGGNREIPVVLVGMGKEVALGSAMSTPQGAIDAQFTLPNDLLPGSYALRAKGKEDADTDFTVMAAPSMPTANMATSSTMSTGEVQQALSQAAPELPARDRPMGEMIVLIATFGLLAGLGFFLALATRERPDGKEAGALSSTIPATANDTSASD